MNRETAVQGTTSTEGGAEWRRVRVWFNEYVIADSTVEVALAEQLEALHRQRFRRICVTNDPATPPER